MKCLIDTNILISASLFPRSVPTQAFEVAATSPNIGVVCDYSIDEMRRVYNRKFPQKIHMMEAFLSSMLLSVEVVSTPPEAERVASEAAIPDIDDRPILRAALKANVDILISGDGDFLDSGIEHPKPMKCADFLKLFQM